MIETLRKRFQENMDRYPSVQWQTVEALLQKDEKMLRALSMMEESCGEPDILVMNGHILLCDRAQKPMLRPGGKALSKEKHAGRKRCRRSGKDGRTADDGGGISPSADSG